MQSLERARVLCCVALHQSWKASQDETHQLEVQRLSRSHLEWKSKKLFSFYCFNSTRQLEMVFQRHLLQCFYTINERIWFLIESRGLQFRLLSSLNQWSRSITRAIFSYHRVFIVSLSLISELGKLLRRAISIASWNIFNDNKFSDSFLKIFLRYISCL